MTKRARKYLHKKRIRRIAMIVANAAFFQVAGGLLPPGYSSDKYASKLNSGEAVVPLDKLKNYLNQPI